VRRNAEATAQALFVGMPRKFDAKICGGSNVVRFNLTSAVAGRSDGDAMFGAFNRQPR